MLVYQGVDYQIIHLVPRLGGWNPMSIPQKSKHLGLLLAADQRHNKKTPTLEVFLCHETFLIPTISGAKRNHISPTGRFSKETAGSHVPS